MTHTVLFTNSFCYCFQHNSLTPMHLCNNYEQIPCRLSIVMLENAVIQYYVYRVLIWRTLFWAYIYTITFVMIIIIVTPYHYLEKLFLLWVDLWHWCTHHSEIIIIYSCIAITLQDCMD